MVSGVLFQGWDNGTLGNTLRVCVTQGSRVGPSEVSAIHPTHTNVCVCVERGHVCIHKAHFPSSLHSTQLFCFQCTLMERKCGPY